MKSKNSGVRPVIARTNPFNGHEELLTDNVFLIGNGISREGFDLERLRPYGTIIGCNALYRDFTPDLLITIDTKMMNEVKKANYFVDNLIVHPRGRAVKIPGALQYRCKYFNTSGCFGMYLIDEHMTAKNCYMLGMDGYQGNVYHQTHNYAVTPVTNFKTIIDRYRTAMAEGKGDTCFINVNKKDTWNIEYSDRYKYMTYREFNEGLLAE